MATVLQNVDQRTQLVGHNRLELLLFRMGGSQRYGINVFKVREVIECPPLRRMPAAHPDLRGLAHVRDRTLPVIDLGRVLGTPLPDEVRGLYLVITEFNRSIQGFLVHQVDRIVNMPWQAIMPPPATVAGNYLTAVTQLDNSLVQIVDVEKILAEISPASADVSIETAAKRVTQAVPLPVLVVDDSSVARSMMTRTLEQVGVRCLQATSGREALNLLRSWADQGQVVSRRLALIVSDIEMPEMDGYTLTAEIRRDVRLQDLRIVLHSSLSGGFNDAMAKKVGADQFLAKFNPDELANAVLRYCGAHPEAPA